VLNHLLDRHDLSESQAGELLHELVSEEVEPLVKAALLAALRTKGETPEEVRGMAKAMAEMAHPLPHRPADPVLDTCGTGGDGSHTINISTGAALVLAACGVTVAKHGNRSISSKSGSADVLEALGISLAATPEAIGRQLADTGFAFLFAPAFHPAMKAVGPVRRTLGVRTVFNILGPLSNPARPSHQVVGAFSPEACELMALALVGMVKKAYVVHGHPGWDEATPCGPFDLWIVTSEGVVRERRDPETAYGIPRCAPDDLTGGDAEANAHALQAVFGGVKGPHRDAIALNAALGLEVLGLASGRDAVARAEQAIDDGAVRALLAGGSERPLSHWK